MDFRTKWLWSLAFAISFITASCGYPQQSRFQTAFLPAAPAAPTPETPVVPAQPNVYLKDVPPFLVSASASIPPVHRTRNDSDVQRAEQAFQRGERLYQLAQYPAARIEFDSAVDWMLEASARTQVDREDLERRLDKMVDAIHQYDLAGMGASAEVEEGRFEKAPLDDILQMTFPVDPKIKDRVLDQVKATVSKLPLSVNDAVLSYINYFSNRGRAIIVAATQRSGRYRSMILRILDEEGVPQELVHLAQAESGFIPRAVSRAAAVGMWQFVAMRGQQYGLKQTPYTDDRMDPEKATRAAARHLRDLYSEFGDWYLALAAYNCGPGVVEKAVERTGYADFWELRNRGVLPAETTNYVPIILAMTIMEKNAREYGLEGLPLDPPLEYDTVETLAPTSLSLIADITGATLSQLAEWNPSLLKGMAPEHYAMHVPKGAGNPLLAALQSIPASHCDSWRMHTVAPGETLAAIAKRYGVTSAGIAGANNLKASEPQEGDRLLIPVAARPQIVAHATVRAAVRRPSPATPSHVAAAHTPAHGPAPATHLAAAAKGQASAKAPAAATRVPAAPKAPATVSRAPVAPSKSAARKNVASARPPAKSTALVARASK